MHDENLFNNARGAAAAIQVKPPFAFSDVKMTIFPLQANLTRLTQFCDGYLNQAPNIVQFKPFLPFVYLILLDYGRMSAAAAQTGWVSQREVAFGVPLRWMKKTDDGPAFHDLAFTTPFIFVDNEVSLTTGREVYGWPKLLARLDPTPDNWIRDPHGSRQVFEIRSRAAADNIGDDLKAPFLSVSHTPMSGLMDFPPRLDGLSQTINAMPSTMMGVGRFWRDALMTAMGVIQSRPADAPPISGFPDLRGARAAIGELGKTKTDDLKGMVTGVGKTLSSLFPAMYSNTINLKQFRDAAEPGETCYQAITAAEMPVQRIGGGGLLGSQSMLAGQFDGGYRVHIINSSSVPVVASLGLIPSENREVDGGVMSSFTPVCPFWCEIDMYYGAAKTVAYRGRSGDWWTPEQAKQKREAIRLVTGWADKIMEEAKKQGIEVPEEVSNGDDDETGFGTNDFRPFEPTNPFNTTRGASEALGGRFRFPGAKLRVLPLLADESVLKRFVSEYLDVPDHMVCTPWGRYVYLIIGNYEKITSDLNPSAEFKVREVSFSIPVKCYERKSPEEDNGRAFNANGDSPGPPDNAGRLLSVAMTTPFNYVDDMGAAITESEIFGVPSLRSVIESPPVGWDGESRDQGVLLETKAMVVPMLGVGAEGTRRTLLKVRDNPMIPTADTAGWNSIAAEWGERLAADMRQKKSERGPRQSKAELEVDEELWTAHGEAFECARGGAMRLFSGLSTIDTLGLKQFRDSFEPNKACYKGIVSRSTRIDRMHSMEEIDKDLTVSILRFPTHPLAKVLGLIPKRSVATDDGMCDEFEPIRPFTISADLVKERGRTLFERVGDDPWMPVDRPESLLGWRRVGFDEVAKSHGQTPAPEITYIYNDPKSGKEGVKGPMKLDTFEFMDMAEQRVNSRIRDIKLINREVPLGTLWDLDGLEQMDEGKIRDLHLFVRTRDQVTDGNDEEQAPPKSDKDARDRLARLKVRELADRLEHVTPATVMDSLLSRDWGAPPHLRSDIKPADFHIRRASLGPDLANHVFPRVECQGNVWPLSFAARRSIDDRGRANYMQLLNEIAVMITGGNTLGPIDKLLGVRPQLQEIAEKSFPSWFCADLFGRVDMLAVDKSHWNSIGPSEMTALIRSIYTFFEKLEDRIYKNISNLLKSKEKNPNIDELNTRMPPKLRRYLKRRWLRRTNRLSAEMVVGTDIEDPNNAPDLIRSRLSLAPITRS